MSEEKRTKRIPRIKLTPELQAQVTEYLKTSTPDSIRKAVYEQLKAGKLTTSSILLLKEVRRQEDAAKNTKPLG